MNNPAIKRQENNPLKERTLEQLRQLLGGDPKTILENLHIKQGLSQKDIADRFHKHYTTVSQWFKRFGISAKTDKERTLEQLKQLLAGDPKKALEDLYINQGLSMTDIAHRFHKVPSTVSTWFKWLGIPTNHYISGKTNRMRSAHQLGKLLGGDPKKVLEDLYIKQGLSKKDIAHRFHKNTATVGNWFKKLRISAKTNKEIGLEQLKNLLGGDPKEVLEDLHQKQGISKTDIALRFHESTAKVNYWFKISGTPTIPNREAKAKRERKLEQLKQLLGGDPKTILEDLYFKQKLSRNDIGNRFHRSDATISNWFETLGIAAIPYRPKTGGSINSAAQKLVLSAIKSGLFEKLPQRMKNLLTLRYLQTGKPLTLDEIAEKMGRISRQRIYELEKTTLHYLQINKTPEEERLRHIQNMKNPEYRKRVLARLHSPEAIEKSRLTRLKLYKEDPEISKRISKIRNAQELAQLRQLLGGDPKEVLEDLYFKQGLSTTEIANRFNKTPSTVYAWFKKFGIRIQSRLVRQYELRMKNADAT